MMNLLITNPQEEQAYLILRSLVEAADRIVTISGDSLFQRWAGMSQWSRFVSKRYRVPDCAADWRAGLIQPDNTPAEERYIQRIEEICKAEAIDVIFPSYDAEVYAFAKNKERLAAQGIVAVVQDYESLTSILDKSLTLAAAEKVGFPIPRTFVPADREALAATMEQSDPPWVLKPRLNAHGVNIVFASDQEELASGFRKLSQGHRRGPSCRNMCHRRRNETSTWSSTVILKSFPCFHQKCSELVKSVSSNPAQLSSRPRRYPLSIKCRRCCASWASGAR